MAMKPVVPRELAHLDVEDVIEHYLRDGGTAVALGFVDELERAYTHIARHPATGSPRYAHQLGFADLRFWRVARFPYLVFYVERADDIDVLRVLHAQRDIPAWMNED
jgi:toxin ParE1/3/4